MIKNKSNVNLVTLSLDSTDGKISMSFIENKTGSLSNGEGNSAMPMLVPVLEQLKSRKEDLIFTKERLAFMLPLLNELEEFTPWDMRNDEKFKKAMSIKAQAEKHYRDIPRLLKEIDTDIEEIDRIIFYAKKFEEEQKAPKVGEHENTVFSDAPEFLKFLQSMTLNKTSPAQSEGLDGVILGCGNPDCDNCGGTTVRSATAEEMDDLQSKGRILPISDREFRDATEGVSGINDDEKAVLGRLREVFGEEVKIIAMREVDGKLVNIDETSESQKYYGQQPPKYKH